MNDTWKITKLCEVENLVHGITVDNNGNIYFTTNGENVYQVRQDNINTEPKILINIKGAQLHGIVWNGNNILYICNYWNHKIHSYSMDTGNISTLVGTGKEGYKDGNIKNAIFYYPWGITMDKNNDLYITYYRHVRKINLSKETVETIAGSTTDWSGGHKDGEAKNAMFDEPVGLAIDSDGTIYVADCGNHCIRAIKNGIVSTIAGNPDKKGYQDGSLLSQSMFNKPCGLVLNVDGNLFVGDGNGLRKIDMNENTVSTLSQGILHQPIFSLTRNTSGSIYIGCKDSILQLENIWKWERFLWIGYLKENSNDCFLACLPKEIIHEIASHFHSNKRRTKKRNLVPLQETESKNPKTTS